jgi:hypothetical protein
MSMLDQIPVRGGDAWEPHTLTSSERGGEKDLSVGAPRLDAVRAWGMHRHNITLEWDMRAQVNV